MLRHLGKPSVRRSTRLPRQHVRRLGTGFLSIAAIVALGAPTTGHGQLVDTRTGVTRASSRIPVQEAVDIGAKNTVFSIKAGVISPGCVYVEDSDCFETNVSYSVGLAVDRRLGERFFGGLYLDTHGVSSDALDETELLLDVGVALKAELASGATYLFRPGIGFGYGRISIFDETSQHLTLRGMLEAILVRARYSLLGEIGVYYSPAGGTPDADVSFGPGLLARVGVGF
jgi:hypothetical protein